MIQYLLAKAWILIRFIELRPYINNNNHLGWVDSPTDKKREVGWAEAWEYITPQFTLSISQFPGDSFKMALVAKNNISKEKYHFLVKPDSYYFYLGQHVHPIDLQTKSLRVAKARALAAARKILTEYF